MDQERRAKENGAKVYEFLLHLFAIGGLVMTCDALTLLEQYTNFKVFGQSDMWWGWLGLTGIAVLRLHILHKVKEEAQKQGKLLTEFMDDLKEKEKK